MGMMGGLAQLLARKYLRRIEAFMRHPVETQSAVLQHLLRRGARTSYGTEHGFGGLRTYEAFQQRVPIVHYEDLEPYIQRMRQGEAHVLWPGTVRWFAKSSGTTGSKSKFIPVTHDALRMCHYRGGYDTLALYIRQVPNTRFYTGKGLTLGGSHSMERSFGRSHEGDLSAILLENIPRWADRIRTPSRQVVLLADWEMKLAQIAKQTTQQRVTSLSGVPSWNMVMLKHLLATAGKRNVCELWPHLEVFFHGGVSFTPYRQQFEQLIPSATMRYMEIYNASEGFIALQDQLGNPDLLLMLDYGVFYEFIPMSEFHRPTPQAVPLEDVRVDVNYALVMSSTNGLWRYVIGDTVKFTSTSPYRMRITGRTRHFINAFGEELIIDNADAALHQACQATGASVSDYTAGPIFMGDEAKGSHEWIVEFDTPPRSCEEFKAVLDRTLCEVNSDYEAKRSHNVTLVPPTLRVVPRGTFFGWMAQRGKIGGQNKVPRLANGREYVEQLLEYASQQGIPIETF